MATVFILGIAWTIVGFGLIARGVKWFGYSRGVYECIQCIVDCGLGIFILFISIVLILMAIGIV